jgi:negative regulator of sigma-B (phosphoserine phosphatase)
MKLTVSHATRPKVGEKVNGDAVVFRHLASRGLLAVVDALGHGPTAAGVARRATEFLEAVPLETELRSILTGLHSALRGTRGAAAMVCVINGEAVEGCGVGNVEMRISAGNVPIVLSPGVLGGTVRNFRVFHGKLFQRSRLVLFSDGVSSRFQLDTLRELAPRELSEHLIAHHGRAYDDATALVVDYEG